MQAQGYRPKSKSLEQVLKTAIKMEAKLIGYDETPCVLTDSCDDLDKHETSESDCDLKVFPISEELARNCNFKFKPTRKLLSPEASVQCNSNQTIMSNGSKADSKDTGINKQGYLSALLSMLSFSYSKTLQVVQKLNRQNHVCMKFVLPTAGNLLYLNVARRQDQVT